MSGVTITLDLSEIAAAGRRFEMVAGQIEDEIARTLDDAMRVAETRARSTAVRDTGENIRRTRGRVDRVPGGAVGRLGSSAPYGYVKELGRRPGQPMPPKGVLLGWMRRHGIPDAAEFPIRRKIGRLGFPGDHNLQRTVEGIAPSVERDLRTRLPRVVRRAVKGMG